MPNEVTTTRSIKKFGNNITGEYIYATSDKDEAEWYSAEQTDTKLFAFHDGIKDYFIPIEKYEKVYAVTNHKEIVFKGTDSIEYALLRDGSVARIKINFSYGTFSIPNVGTTGTHTEYGYRINSIHIDNGVNSNGLFQDLTLGMYYDWVNTSGTESIKVSKTITIPKGYTSLFIDSYFTTTSKFSSTYTYYMLFTIGATGYKNADYSFGMSSSYMSKGGSNINTYKFAPIQWRKP